jgi:hypothetical protein
MAIWFAFAFLLLQSQSITLPACTVTQCGKSSDKKVKTCADLSFTNGTSVLTYYKTINDFYDSCSGFEYCPIDALKLLGRNGDSVACQPKKLLYMACNMDYECQSNACFANGTCGDYWLIDGEPCTSSYDCNHQYYFCDTNTRFRTKPTCVSKFGSNINCTYSNPKDPFADLCKTNEAKCFNSVCTKMFTQPIGTTVSSVGGFASMMCQTGFINSTGQCVNISSLPALTIPKGQNFVDCTSNSNLCVYTLNGVNQAPDPSKCKCAEDDLKGARYCDFGGGEPILYKTVQLVYK